MSRLTRLSIPLVIAAILTSGGVLPVSADEDHKAIKVHAHNLSDDTAIDILSYCQSLPAK